MGNYLAPLGEFVLECMLEIHIEEVDTQEECYIYSIIVDSMHHKHFEDNRTGLEAAALSGQDHRLMRRPRRNAEGADRGHLRRQRQHQRHRHSQGRKRRSHCRTGRRSRRRSPPESHGRATPD